MKNTIGEIIFKMRTERKLSRKALCKGICSESMLAKLENNERVPEMIIVDTLLKRLGKSPDKLEVIISQYDYLKMEAYDRIIDWLRLEEYEKATEEMDEYSMNYPTSPIDVMFFKRLEAIVAYQKNNDFDLAERLLDECIKLTLEGFDVNEIAPYSLATFEIENIIMKCYVWMKKSRFEVAEKWLCNIYQYIKKYITDDEEKVKILPKTIFLYGQILLNKKEYTKVIFLCEDALGLLIDNYSSSFVIPILELLINVYDILNDIEKSHYYKKHRDNIEAVYSIFEENINSLNVLYYSPSMRQVFLDSEIVHDMRIARGLSQLNFIEGIYSEQTAISRLENGKTKIKNNKLEELLARLNIEKGRYNCYLTTTNFEALEQLTYLHKHLSGKKYHLVEKDIYDLEKMLDTNVLLNNQQIQFNRIRLKVRKEEIDFVATKEELLRMLYESEVLKDNKIARRPFPIENSIIVELGIVLNKMRKKNEAINLLQEALDTYENSVVGERYTYRSWSVLGGNLCKYYGENSEPDRSIAVGKVVIKQGLIIARMQGVRSCLIHLDAAMETYDGYNGSYIHKAYTLSEFYNFQASAKKIKEYITQKYNYHID